MSWLTKLCGASINVQLLDNTTQNIISLIRNACQAIPQLSNGQFGITTARICGGWVRDNLLGLPSKDIDISVDNMSGEQFAAFLKQFDPAHVGDVKTNEERPDQIKNLAVGFLNVYGQPVEILSLRKEEYEPGNRNPKVSSATPQEDSMRRDLTLNSMFYNINTGQIEDFTNKGLEDLKTMTLRTPLDPVKTFMDDPLRVLRTLRFYSKYENSQIAPEVLEAMKNPQIQQLIVNKLTNPNAMGIVPERISIEMKKMMTGSRPDKAIEIMYQNGLLERMLNLPPTFHPLNMDQRNRHHKLSLIHHTIEVLKNVNKLAKDFKLSDDERMKLNFASLIHDIGKLDPRSWKQTSHGDYGYSGDPNNPEAITHEQSSSDYWLTFAKALQLSNDETESIHDIISSHMTPHTHVQDNVSDKSMRRYMRKNPAWTFHYIHAIADTMSKGEPNPDAQKLYYDRMERMRQLSQEQPQLAKSELLNGNEIMQIVGLPANPPPGLKGYVNLVKERIKNEQDSNPQLTKEQAIAIVQNMVNSGELQQYFDANQKTAGNWLQRIIRTNL